MTPKRFRTLSDLAAIYGSDKGTVTGARHGYTLIYDKLFAPMKKGREVTILEIGLRYDPYYSQLRRVSPSLSMWHDYFVWASIYGFDINDFSEMANERIHIYQGDQGDAESLASAFHDVSEFTVVIDDGSHASYHQLVTLKTLLPKVRPGGLYIIEDLHWQPEDLEMRLPLTRKMSDLLSDSTFLECLGVTPRDVEIAVNGKLGVIRKPLLG